jgi:hypothetical protein
MLAAALAGLLVGCLPAPAMLPPEATVTPLPPTLTPTATTVWFPPTPTYTPYPTLVVTPTLDARVQFGPVILTDDFSDPEAWALGKGPAGSSALGKNELTLALSKPGGYLYSLRQGTLLKDYYLEITASPSLCLGADEYGLLLRVSERVEFYRFSLTCDGQARVDKYFGARASSPLPLTLTGSVPRGAPSTSRLAVQAQGKDISFFANGEFIYTLSDPSLISGGIGVFARSNGDNVVTVNFSDLAVYEPGE